MFMNFEKSPSIENVLLIWPHQRCRVAGGRRSAPHNEIGPPVPVPPIGGGVPEKVIDGAVRPSIESVLLIWPHQRCRVAGGRRSASLTQGIASCWSDTPIIEIYPLPLRGALRR